MMTSLEKTRVNKIDDKFIVLYLISSLDVWLKTKKILHINSIDKQKNAQAKSDFLHGEK